MTEAVAHLDWRALRVDGADARSFLNGLLSQDVAKLPAWSAAPCCLLTPKGKLQAEFVIAECGGSFFLAGAPCGIENARKTLDKMSLLSQSRLDDPGFAVAWSVSQDSVSPWSVRRLGSSGFVIRDPRIDPAARLLLAPPDQLPLATISGAEFESRRIEARVALFGVDADEDCLPLEAGMDAAVSFTKGCYMGQETMSRIHHMGHVNRLLRRLRVSGARAGAEVRSGEKVLGKVTSASGSAALALLRAEGSQPGARVSVDGREGVVA